MDQDPEDSSSDTNGEDESDGVLSRHKRGIDWCGVEENGSNSSKPTTKLQFYGNPNFSNKMQLYSRTKYFLAVSADGSVYGTQDHNDLHTRLELTNAGDVGEVKIRGLHTNFYLGMDSDGCLYSTDQIDENVVFKEGVCGDYKVYASKWFIVNEEKYFYVGIKKSGKPKNGLQTEKNQKAVQFLSVRDA